MKACRRWVNRLLAPTCIDATRTTTSMFARDVLISAYRGMLRYTGLTLDRAHLSGQPTWVDSSGRELCNTSCHILPSLMLISAQYVESNIELGLRACSLSKEEPMVDPCTDCSTRETYFRLNIPVTSCMALSGLLIFVLSLCFVTVGRTQ